MSQRLVTSTVNTNIPGAYPTIKVISTVSGLATSGVVVLMGEADGGPDFTSVDLKNNFFGPSDAAKIASIYTSGPIVDAMRALAAPSNDPDIVGSASTIFVVKTNKGTAASSVVDTDYGTLSDQNFGLGGNNYKYSITSLDAEVAPKYVGSAIGAFGAPLNGQSFTLRLEGTVAHVITLSGTASDHDTIGHLVTELNGLLPAGIVASADLSVPTALNLTVAVDSAAYRKSWGKSFELVDSTPGDLAAIGLVSGLVVSSQEPAVEVQITRSDTGTNETFDIIPAVSLSIGYLGTTATLTINGSTISTTVTGGTGSNLSIPKSQFQIISDLATYINAQPGYSCSCPPSANQLPVSGLDQVSAIGICTSVAGRKPGRVKNGLYSFSQQIATSSALQFSATATGGIPAPGLATFLSGGVRGGTLAADIVAAVDSMAGIQCNIIVPLFSRDATQDITDGLTSSSSTYTIAAINQLVKSHCIEFSTPTLKRNRMAILSMWDTYANIKSESQGLASYRCALAMQRVTNPNSQGQNVSFLPWYSACLAAGMQTGGFYKAIVNHYTNASSFTDPDGYDSGAPSDVEDALTAGLLPLTQDTGGIRWVSDQTTYGLDTNFVYNSIQAVYLSDILALDIAQKFQSAFVGKSLADVSAASALSYLQQLFDFYKKLKITATSDDAPLGYKNAKIVISAPEMDVSVEAKLATAIYFIPIDLSLSSVQQSAS